jgi:hypothetical protein
MIAIIAVLLDGAVGAHTIDSRRGWEIHLIEVFMVWREININRYSNICIITATTFVFLWSLRNT